MGLIMSVFAWVFMLATLGKAFVLLVAIASVAALVTALVPRRSTKAPIENGELDAMLEQLGAQHRR